MLLQQGRKPGVPAAIYQIMSDIHLEFSTAPFPIATMFNKRDVTADQEVNLILAGDVGYPSHANYRRFLHECTRHYDNVFLVAGNHEFYDCRGTGRTMDQVVDSIRDVVADINVDTGASEMRGELHFLNNDMVRHGNTYILGSTLWTGVGLDERYGAKFMNDYRYISDFSVDTSTALFHTNHDFLKTSLRVVEEEKAGNADVRCIVVTHHLPSHAVVHDKYKDMTHLTPFFAAHCDDLLHKPVDYWVYGHTHVANSHEINGVHVLCNPFGYPSETSYVDMQKTIVV